MINKVKDKHIAIAGCGWVGQALTKELVANHYQVVATTSTPEKLALLTELGATAQILTLPEGNIDAYQWLTNVDTLIISITPRFKRGEQDYPDKVNELVNMAQYYNVENLIMLSSTGVYDGVKGNASEHQKLPLLASKALLLYQAEQRVLSANLRSVVLRLAGLVGPKRHPARFMANKVEVPNPKSPVNLVHQADVVSALRLVIENKAANGVYNVASDTHPTRKNFYSQACIQQDLVPPSFSEQKDKDHRIVTNDKLKELGWKPQHPNLLNWLQVRAC